MPGVKPTMDEWKSGTLHSGSKAGPIVKNQKQAIAIALSEKRKAAGQPAAFTPKTKKPKADGLY